MLQSMGLQRVRLDLATEQQQSCLFLLLLLLYYYYTINIITATRIITLVVAAFKPLICRRTRVPEEGMRLIKLNDEKVCMESN